VKFNLAKKTYWYLTSDGKMASKVLFVMEVIESVDVISTVNYNQNDSIRLLEKESSYNDPFGSFSEKCIHLNQNVNNSTKISNGYIKSPEKNKNYFNLK